MDWKEFSGKNVNEAVQNACIELESASDQIEYEVIEKESKGFLGIGSRPALIRAKKKNTISDIARNFIQKILDQMEVVAEIEIVHNEEEKTMDIDLKGDNMAILIGKRGQTLDSLQYLISLVVNKDGLEYVKVKLDTENYRERRKETLENLAKNMASKAKKLGKNVVLDPMNPYERRIIHSALQGDQYVETHSEGEEPYRKVVIVLKKEYRKSYSNNRYGNKYSSYNKKGSYRKNNSYRGGYKKYNSNRQNESVGEKSEDLPGAAVNSEK